MINNEKVKNILAAWKKFWYLILILAFIGAGFSYYEKAKVATITPKSNETIMSMVVKYDTPQSFHIDSSSGAIVKDDNLNQFFKSTTIYNATIKTLEGHYDISKFDTNWNQLNAKEKEAWFKDVLSVKYLGNDTYEFMLELSSDTPKSFDYIDQNGMIFLKEYVNVLNGEILKILPNTKIVYVDQFKSVEPLTISKESIVDKYVVAGGVLGAILAASILTIYGLGKNR